MSQNVWDMSCLFGVFRHCNLGSFHPGPHYAWEPSNSDLVFRESRFRQFEVSQVSYGCKLVRVSCFVRIFRCLNSNFSRHLQWWACDWLRPITGNTILCAFLGILFNSIAGELSMDHDIAAVSSSQHYIVQLPCRRHLRYLCTFFPKRTTKRLDWAYIRPR